MKNINLEILKLLKTIDKKFCTPNIDKNIFEEEQENIKKFENAYNELLAQINDLKKNTFTDKTMVEEKLVYLLLNLSTIIWCYEQLDELIRLAIQKIPDN